MSAQGGNWGSIAHVAIKAGSEESLNSKPVRLKGLGYDTIDIPLAIEAS